MLIESKSLEFLNMSGTLFTTEAVRKVLQGLCANCSVKYLNLSCNKFNTGDKEFGARIGRLI